MATAVPESPERNETLAPRPGPSADPTIDVVILTWNDGPLLERAMASVLASTGVNPRIVVVDNGSDIPVTVPEGVTLLTNASNRGVAAGRNQGIAVGSAPFVLLLDSDARLEPASLRRLHDALQKTGCSMTVPVFIDQDPEQSAGRAPGLITKLRRTVNLTVRYRPMAGSGPSTTSWPVDFGIGACQFFTRDVWRQVHGIDERYFYGPEDVDFCLRIIDAGHQIR
ncbi:MAG: glycosyltransferase, partial [Acidimicrobiia bacterium]|nr:glycosyltransferase [Acidimicrobiia bacterium]